MSEKICVIIPVYNNEKTIENVIERCKKHIPDIFVINDGSTDKTGAIVHKIEDIHVHSFEKNQGKGAALKKGFEIAGQQGFHYGITLDADGQHFPEDIPQFVEKIRKNPRSIIIGVREFDENVTGRSKFGRNFSNFWTRLFTLKTFSDVQSGYRVYPLPEINKIRISASRYDFEVEILIKAAWRGIPVVHIPIRVHYDKPEERISHFKAVRDNVRQTLGFFKLGIQAVYRLPLSYVIRLFRKK
jgi:glycosyltransferase involved in cell wall biosynthesis